MLLDHILHVLFCCLAFDVDFGCFVLQRQFQFLSRKQDELHYFFFITIIVHKNPRVTFTFWKYRPAQLFHTITYLKIHFHSHQPTFGLHEFLFFPFSSKIPCAHFLNGLTPEKKNCIKCAIAMHKQCKQNSQDFAKKVLVIITWIPQRFREIDAPATEWCYALRRQLKIFLALVQIKILAFSLSIFYDAAKTAKKGLTQADRTSEIKQFHKHVRHSIDIDALKI